MVQGNEANDIDRINISFYDGRSPDRAFAHWALKCLLADIEPQDTYLRDFHTVIGGPSDLGIDAYWIDDANSRIILVQAKDTRVTQRRDVMEFRAAIESLQDERYVYAHGNNRLKEAYSSRLGDCIYDESFTIHGVFAAGAQVRGAARDYCKAEGSAPIYIRDKDSLDNSSAHLKEVTLEVLSKPEIAERARQLASLESPLVTLPIADGRGQAAFHYMGGAFQSIMATVPARSLAEAFYRHRSAMFQYNPRGPQGSNQTNTDIKDTLADPNMRHLFHLLNNGITVVCESLVYNENDQTVTIRNFQVVNGCQTVFTLSSSIDELTPEVQVNIRIIEGLQQCVGQIAKASNSQTVIKTHQLASMSDEHTRIAEILDSGNDPWYYEKQLGQKKFNTPIQRAAHQNRFRDRTFTILQLGQYGASFVGYPGLAKYDSKAIFEKRGHGMFVYDKVFMDRNTKEQLLLPVLVGQRVFAEVASRIRTSPIDPDADAESFTIHDWLQHARHHLVGLVGIIASENTLENLPSHQISAARVATINDWFPDAFKQAYDAADWVVSVERAAGNLTNIRNFFRDPDTYSKMKSRMLSQVR